jgi:hypothetical protein
MFKHIRFIVVYKKKNYLLSDPQKAQNLKLYIIEIFILVTV